jgi:hypothetical protein
MANRTDTMRTPPPGARNWTQIQRRHTIAAVVYFAYGLFYLFGAQYLTSMQATQRGMANAPLFFALGAVITVLFPLLIYSRFALALSLTWRPRSQRQTLFVNFTLLLGILVVFRVVALLRGGLYAQSPLYTAALLVAAINAACLLWAGLSRAVWVTREPEGGELSCA